MIPLNSSTLRAVHYDPFTARLTVEFRNDRIYQYWRVPAKVFQGLLRAASHGSYFAQNIRKEFTYRKVR
jgi:hypothetical protein